MKAAFKANAGTAALTAASATPRRFDDRSPTIEDLDSCVLQLTISTDCTNKQAIKPSLINRRIMDHGSWIKHARHQYPSLRLEEAS
jgi:hypothetical protein